MTDQLGPKKILQLGRIQRGRGLSGEVKITTSGQLLLLKIPATYYLYTASASYDGFLKEPVVVQQITIQKIREEGPMVLVATLEGIKSRDAAEELKGLYFGLELTQAIESFGGGTPPYLFEYMDAQVTDRAEPSLTGTVTRAIDSGSGFLLEIALPQGLILVPGNSPYVVSFEKGKLVCENLLYLLPS